MFVDWLRSWDECSATTLPALPRLVLNNAATTDGLSRIYEYLFYSSLATSCINAHSDLMLFKGLAHENVRARFAGLDREIMSLASTLHLSSTLVLYLWDLDLDP